MTIKVAVMALAAVLAAVAPVAANDPNEAQVIAQASNGKLGREVSFLVCANMDQTSAAVSALFVPETGSNVTYAFVMMAESRLPVNLANVPGLPAHANFSIALFFDTSDLLPSSVTCDVVYYSGNPLREVDRAPLTVRTFVKR